MSPLGSPSKAGVILSPAHVPGRIELVENYLPGSYDRLYPEERELTDLLVQLYNKPDPDGRVRKCLRWGGIILKPGQGGLEAVPLFLIAEAKAKGNIPAREVDWFVNFSHVVVAQGSQQAANANLLPGDDIAKFDLHPDPHLLTLEEQDVMEFCEQLWENRESESYDPKVLKCLFTNMVQVSRASNGLRISAPGYYVAAKLGLIKRSDFDVLKERVRSYQSQANTLQEVDETSRLGAKIQMTPDGRFNVEPGAEIQERIRKLGKGESLEDEFTYRILGEEGPMRVTVTLNYGSPSQG